MHLAEVFFEERSRHLLSWDSGPVLGEIREDGALHIKVPPAASEGGRTGPIRVGLDGDAVLFIESREVFASFYLDGADLTVVETGLNGERQRWKTSLSATEQGAWTIQDVLEGWDEGGGSCIVLTVADSRGSVEFHQTGAGKAVRTHRPAATGQLVHWDLRHDAAVIRQDRGPWDPLLHLERPLSAAAAMSISAQWKDGWNGQGAVVVSGTTGDPHLAVWDLLTSSVTPVAAPLGHVDDARILRDASRHIVALATLDGSDTLHVCDPGTGETKPLPLNGTGRLRFRVAGERGTGLYSFSTLAGSSWLWLDREGTVHQARGDVPRYEGGATLTHVWYGQTPALEYMPEQPPIAMVVSLHGGPESLERDELRWDGMYRVFLDAGIAVIGLNYCGSTGYGAAHTERARKDWLSVFQEDLRACVEAARTWDIDPADIALLGGSFGGGLALLGCVLERDLAGAVASAPLIDIRHHARHATAADSSYGDWFEDRFELAASATAVQRVFDPEYLTTTAPEQRVFLIHGDQDEVTGWQHSRHAADLASRRGLPWTLVTERGVGHVPADRGQTNDRYRHIRAAVSEVLGLEIPRQR
ncbi:prolyl oligopeptidase family serine peptidase [Streptomyces sp. NBC_00191]|uniref:alpha/beta hydrolase family protein n=1 Tax=Streptomyces sp. NBC_00191 TaxID=2975674 RepID=UPI003254389B